eukprot:6172494-Pyramimonas_sp.AAC.1
MLRYQRFKSDPDGFAGGGASTEQATVRGIGASSTWGVVRASGQAPVAIIIQSPVGTWWFMAAGDAMVTFLLRAWQGAQRCPMDQFPRPWLSDFTISRT